MDPMYLPQNNGPHTTLAEAINSAVTSITVEDASVLPDAPNVVTIGLGEDAELMLVTLKNNNILVVERGYNGTIAKSWDVGEWVYRAITAQDISALQNNVQAVRDSKIDIAKIANNLTTTAAGYTLDARVANQLPILGTGSLTDVNLNTVVRAGFYRLYTGVTSGPTQFSADYGLLIVAAVPNTTTLAQILVGYDGNVNSSSRMATRTCYLTNNVWSAWREFTSGPSQIQTGTVTATVDASSTASVSITFPTAFPAGATVKCFCQVVTSDPVNRSAAPTSITTTTATISIKNNITSSGSLSVWWLAVGQ